MEHEDELNSAIVYDRDFNYNYFGFKTLGRSYLLRINGKVAEKTTTFDHEGLLSVFTVLIFLRVIETYSCDVSKISSPMVSPCLFNAGTPRPQMSSCFLLAMKDDSIEGIWHFEIVCFDLKRCWRNRFTHPQHSFYRCPLLGTNGTSNGIIPMVRYSITLHVMSTKGGNKRPGAFA